ncbi:SigE family RNA polymerase sigma factor [Kribbella sp. VKM Ac-2566]|uniref:SigE family RNA polymerase sigma factor n=1 Tax=Kribbella sp. VKM Ac-2566 TaxID=2512218 RepID=UPI00106428CF|nr:SigE family RNA polymerase sigma factor [Kribbella sp. VKM Ac-2566]TDX08321.1 RNA polymerase sigma-70 factor (sigma-E family) [Kribbella sp. VKM Ac-2566]
MRQAAEDFEEFAHVRTPHLYRTAWLLVGDRRQAEDLVQETLAKMFRAWRGISRIDNPAAYAQTVLARTFVSQWRRRLVEHPYAEVPEIAQRQGDTELRVALQKALYELAPLDRAVLVLRFFEDRSVEQVALDLDKKPGAIRTRTSRALDRLRVVHGDDAVHLASL